MRLMELAQKLTLLGESAKYDVSCASSGSSRSGGALGRALPSGVCHTWSSDGRCVSLLKVLYSNICIYDCAYCINRSSNDIRRTSFTVDELVDLVISFYRRNYIEGLFLSSGVFASPDITMEQLIRVARSLREERGFAGYIHLKAIPGASPAYLKLAGLYADRLSVNLELPSERSLRRLAPQKAKESIIRPMRDIAESIAETANDRKRGLRSAPRYSPAGQSTQLIIGASPEPDRRILTLSGDIYRRYGLKRVYYSGYSPVNRDDRLPAEPGDVLRREHRLYQADWLLRFYHFSVEEILDSGKENLDREADPKLAWALRHPEFFPVEINRADYESLLRVPGIGYRSAARIVAARRAGSLGYEDLSRIGVVLKRARHFLTCRGKREGEVVCEPDRLRRILAPRSVEELQLRLAL